MSRTNHILKFMSFIKRRFSVSSSCRNKNYNLHTKHIKTDLNNCSYVVKKTTAIPKKHNYSSIIACRKILPQNLKLDFFNNNPALVQTGVFEFEYTDGQMKNLNEDILLEELINKLVSENSAVESNHYGYDAECLKGVTSNNKNFNCNLDHDECRQLISGNDDFKQVENMDLGEPCANQNFECDSEELVKKDLNLLHNIQERIINPYIDLNEIDHLGLQSNNHESLTDLKHETGIKDNFSFFCKVKDLVREKISKLMHHNSNIEDLSSENILVLCPDIPEKKTFIYLKDNCVHVIEPPLDDLSHEIRNYIKKIDKAETVGAERVNFIKFDKVSTEDSFFDAIHLRSQIVPDSGDCVSETQIRDTKDNNALHDTRNYILKVQQSFSLENDTDKSWISTQDENKNGDNVIAMHLTNDHSLNSEPPLAGNVPINKDKLIEETSVPNTSILNIINSVDRSAVIIQKDLYITDQIIQKIQKEEEKEKQREVEKNKLETVGSRADLVLSLEIHSVKDGKITFSLSDMTSDFKNEFSKYLEYKERGNATEVSSEISNKSNYKNILAQIAKGSNPVGDLTNPLIFLGLKDRSTNQPVVHHKLRNSDSKLKTRKRKVGSAKMFPKTKIIPNNDENSHLTTDGKSNQKDISVQIKSIDSSKKGGATDIFAANNVPEQNTLQKCTNKNEQISLQEYNWIESSSDNIIKINSILKKSELPLKYEDNFKVIERKLNDLDLHFTLHSIDDGGNIVFNLLDKTDKVLSKVNLAPEKIGLKTKENKLFCNGNKEPLKVKSSHLNDYRISFSESPSNNKTDQFFSEDKVNEQHLTNSQNWTPSCQHLKNKSQKIPELSKQRSDIRLSDKPLSDDVQMLPLEQNCQMNCFTNKINEPIKCQKPSEHQLAKMINNNKPKPVSKQATEDDFSSFREQKKKEQSENLKIILPQKEKTINQQNSFNKINGLKGTFFSSFDLKHRQKDDSKPSKKKSYSKKKVKRAPIDCKVLDNSVECLLGKKNEMNHRSYIPKRKRFGGKITNTSSDNTVDHIIKTTISSIKKNNFTDINVSEVETFVDSRLPIPFSTETFFQIFGSNSLLHRHASVIDLAKYKLTSEKPQSYPSNTDVMAKLEDIHNGIKQLKTVAEAPALQKKMINAPSKSLVPSTETTHPSKNNYEVVKNNRLVKDTMNENSPDSKNAFINKNEKLTKVEENLTPRTNKQSQFPIKSNQPKKTEPNQFHRPDHNIKLEIKKPDSKVSKIQEKKSLIVLNPSDKTDKLDKPLKENIKDTKIGQSNRDLRKAGTSKPNKLVRVNYIDIFNSYKKEKGRKDSKISIQKKSLYDHRGLSKRDKKILKEITTSKQKSSRQKIKRRSLRTVPSKKAGKEFFKQSANTRIKEPPNNQSSQISKANADNSRKSIKPKVLTNQSKSPGSVHTNASPETNKITLPHKQVKYRKRRKANNSVDVNKNKTKNFINANAKPESSTDSNQPVNILVNNDDPSYKVLPNLINKTTETKKIRSYVLKETPNKQLKKDPFRNKDSKIKLMPVGKSNDTSHRVGQSKKQEHTPKKFEEKKVKSNDNENSSDEQCKKPLCHTYIATEAYINRPERSNSIPDEPAFSFPKLAGEVENDPEKNIPPPPKVTILETYNRSKDAYSNNVEVPEDFKRDLITKSQQKIEQKSNIDYRDKTPKIRNPKSKLKLLNDHKQKEKTSPLSGSNSDPIIKKQPKVYKRTDTEYQTFTPKTIKNKTENISAKAPQKQPNSDIRNKVANTSIVYSEDDINKIEISKKDSGMQSNEAEPKPIERTPIQISGNEMKESIKHSSRNEQVKITHDLREADNSFLTPQAKMFPDAKANQSNFPILLIDVDKMSKEIKPDLDLKNCQKCSVSHDRIVDFPLQNPKKNTMFDLPSKILCLGPSRDPMLRIELNFFPSVTKIMNSTIPEDSREVLRKWRRNMIEKMGENGFKSFYKSELTNGSKFHSQLHDRLFNGIQIPNDSLHLSLKSIHNVLEKLTDFYAVNSHVIHRKLAYRGVVDCIAKYQTKPVLIEWKRLENPNMMLDGSALHTSSLQLAAYTGAVNYDDAYKFQLSGGLIVVAFNDGSEAEVIEVPKDKCLEDWKAWLKRLYQFHELVHKKQI